MTSYRCQCVSQTALNEWPQQQYRVVPGSQAATWRSGHEQDAVLGPGVGCCLARPAEHGSVPRPQPAHLDVRT